MPEPDERLEQALAWLEPGGQLVVLDSFPEPGRPLARWVIHAKAPFVRAQPNQRPLQLLRERLDGLRIRHFHHGVYTLVSGRRAG
jgi:hypothetical protein